ncbi:STAS/SEC14 domain-containing protein [Sulfuricaulis sp.]|uniref:STAS/SEC14 domain-containing protein n=1 Tax=Sulfuricaulis sp. TaxID=2003553 RepID=UPI00355962A0
MAYEIVSIDGPVIQVRISGTMQLVDQQALQAAAKKLIAQGIKPRVLVSAENFQGWEKGVDWGDVSFLMDFGDGIVKMAIVGDEKWKEQVFMFTAKGLRKTAIEYFPPAALAQALAWVRA